MSNKPLCGEILDFSKSHHTCDEEPGHYPDTSHASRGKSLGKPYELKWGKGIEETGGYKDWDNAEILKRKTNS